MKAIKKEEGRADLSEVKSYWLTKLSSIPRRFGITELADMLEETDCFASDFQKAFKELDAEGKVKNQDAKKARPVSSGEAGEWTARSVRRSRMEGCCRGEGGMRCL